MTDAKKLNEEEIQTLSKERLDKANGFVYEKDRRLSLAAGLSFQKALKAWGLDPGKEKLGYHKYGKPYLIDHPDIHFNISHSVDMAICVISDKEIGCDIEKIRKYDPDIALRCFSKKEMRYIEEGKDKDFAFTRIWTLKESFLKAIGTGLRDDMNEVSVVSEDGKIEIEESISNREWNVFIEDLDDYLISIVEEK